MKRKLSGLLLAAMLAGALAGCTNGGNPSPSPSAGPSGSPSAGPSTAAQFDTGKSIGVVSREDGSGTRSAFIELFGIEVKGDDGSKKDMTTKEAVIANKTGVMMTNVAGDKYAIGYISLGSLNETVKALDIDEAKATAENVKNGSYAIARPFYLATKDDVSDLTQDFIGFILSKEGQDIIAGNGYIAIDDAPAAYSGARPSGKIVVAGSSSVSPVMEKLQEAYMILNSGAAIEIQQTDSSAGMKGAIEGTCDIGMSSRELKDSEKETLTPIQIALDGIAVIVSPENPVSGMTKTQVKSIFTGEAGKWSDVTQ